MVVELLTFGDELLDGRRVDTNTSWLGRQFTSMGAPPRFRQSTTDRQEDIVEAFLRAFDRADIIVTTGGLGPTADDLTFEALAEALGEPLAFHPDWYEKIKQRFAAKGLACPESNRRQAMLPKSAKLLVNDWGTAPGICVEKGRALIFSLPGVPLEMKHIFEQSIRPLLSSKMDRSLPRREKIYSFVGLGESLLEEAVDRARLQSIAGAEVRIAYTASFPQVDVTLSVAAPGNVETVLHEAHARLMTELEPYLVSENGESIENRLVALYESKGWSLSLAESFTGGLLAGKIIDVPGSSSIFDRGWITYSNRSKVEQLGVSPKTLATFGAVSKECAIEMAKGAQRESRFGASEGIVALATTGIAGPSGATPEKPVGLAYMAVVGPKFESGNEDVQVQEFRFRWDRNRNRLIAVYEALKMLLRVSENH